jgi:hypothetical protein
VRPRLRARGAHREAPPGRLTSAEGVRAVVKSRALLASPERPGLRDWVKGSRTGPITSHRAAYLWPIRGTNGSL